MRIKLCFLLFCCLAGVPSKSLGNEIEENSRYYEIEDEIERVIMDEEILRKEIQKLTEGTFNVTVEGSNKMNMYGTTQQSPNTTESYGTTQQPPNTTESYGTTQQPPNTTESYGTTQQPPNTTESYGTTQQPPNTTESYGTTQQPPNTTESYGTTQQPPNTTESYGTTQQPPNTTESYGTTQQPPNTTESYYDTTKSPRITTTEFYETTVQPEEITTMRTSYGTTKKPKKDLVLANCSNWRKSYQCLNFNFEVVKIYNRNIKRCTDTKRWCKYFNFLCGIDQIKTMCQRSCKLCKRSTRKTKSHSILVLRGKRSFGYHQRKFGLAMVKVKSFEIEEKLDCSCRRNNRVRNCQQTYCLQADYRIHTNRQPGDNVDSKLRLCMKHPTYSKRCKVFYGSDSLEANKWNKISYELEYGRCTSLNASIGAAVSQRENVALRNVALIAGKCPEEGSGSGDGEGSGSGDGEGSGSGDEEGSGSGDEEGSGSGKEEGSGK